MHTEQLNIEFCLINRLNDSTFLMAFKIFYRVIIAFEIGDRNQWSFVSNYVISISSLINPYKIFNNRVFCLLNSRLGEKLVITWTWFRSSILLSQLLKPAIERNLFAKNHVISSPVHKNAYRTAKYRVFYSLFD